MTYPKGPWSAHALDILTVLIEAGEPLDSRDVSERVGYDASLPLRKLFVCGMVSKVDREGHGRNFRYAPTSNILPARERRKQGKERSEWKEGN